MLKKRTKEQLDNIRMAPHSVEAEESVLGSAMIDPSVLPTITYILAPEDFYIIKNGWIWEAMQALIEHHDPLDFMTLCNELENRGQLSEVGGSAYISHLINVVPTAIHAEGYAKIVKRFSARRKFLDMASKIAQRAYDDETDILDAYESSICDLTHIKIQVANRLDGQCRLINSDDILTREFDPIEMVIPEYLPVGLCFLAGKPKVGKSWLALQIAGAVASGGNVLDKHPQCGAVLYLSLEDTPRRLQNRMKKQMWPSQLPVDFITMENFDQEIGDLTQGGGERLARLIEARRYKLVVIDTFSRAIGQYMKSGDQSDSSMVTRALAPIQRMSMMLSCGTIFIDHHSKSAGNAATQDAVTDTLGSISKGGVQDTSWGLYKERGKLGAKLQIVGRDIDEDKNLAISFDRELGIWKFDGNATDLQMTERRDELINALEASGRMTITELSDYVNQDRSNTHKRINDLVNEGYVRRIQEGKKIYFELCKAL